MMVSNTSMTIDLRLVISIIVYIITVVSIFAGFKYKMKKLDESNQNMKNVMFLEKGGLNIVSNSICHERRKSIHNIIDKEACFSAILSDKIDNLSENMYMMMGAQGLTPKKFIKKDPKKTFYQCEK